MARKKAIPGLGNPPGEWEKGGPARRHWARCRRAWPWLNAADRPALILLCRALVRLDEAEEDMDTYVDGPYDSPKAARLDPHVLERTISASRLHALKCMDTLGVLPDSARRLAVEAKAEAPSDEEDPAEAFLSRRR